MVENCEYSDTAVKSKSCYHCFCVFYCEDVYYGRYSRKCRDCSGISMCVNCEWCAECIDCVGCYMSDYCQDCKDCSECQHCLDCYSCKNCFGCVGLYQKQYYLFNKQLTKEEYESRLMQIDLLSSEHRTLIQKQLDDLKLKTPIPALHQNLTENCTWDHITESNNCIECYDIFTSEDCMYCVEANANKDSLDLTVCFETEFSYQCVQSPLCHGCNFCVHTDRSVDSEFCVYSRNLKNCFGCVYLENKEYHILNEPYSPEEYRKIVSEIKQELIHADRYNLLPYFVSDYEQNRLDTEQDPVIITKL